ncbi:YggS family pyridoxal phosphate-dependent enzyme [Candidatus Poribacteria bacterium]|nr:YggS family pyridoxal phosphate-dependent enzyme [Candidatus Poribacteria bacterium]
MNRIVENLASVKERMAAAAERSGRAPDSIKLVTVTKGRSITNIQTVLAAGATDIGENRVQEAQQKFDLIQSFCETVPNIQACEWHLVGHLQRNKVKSALDMFTLIHSVDSLRLLAEIARRAEARKQQTEILIQINTTGEASKFGIDSEDVRDFIEKSLTYSGARIVGLMTMGVLSSSPEINRPAFALLRTLSEKVKAEKFPGITMEYLSMGMTNDFEVAIEEGANLVRIGRAIFGNAG